METVFDHNITEYEWEMVMGSLLTPDYCMKSFSQQSWYKYLACLYYFRNDENKAKVYLDKLPDLVKLSILITVTHP